jgi:hypothetical protein
VIANNGEDATAKRPSDDGLKPALRTPLNLHKQKRDEGASPIEDQLSDLHDLRRQVASLAYEAVQLKASLSRSALGADTESLSKDGGSHR